MPNPYKNLTEPQENIVSLSLTQAAKEAGISKSTLSVAIQKGRLSAIQRSDGSYEIEPVELFRVYPPKAGTTGVQERVRPVAEPKPNPTEPMGSNTGLLHKELEKMEALLRREQEASQREREAVQREQQRVADLEKRLDQATEERRLAEERNHALMLRLMPPSPSPQQAAPELAAVIDELRKRLEASEARNQALVGGSPPTPEEVEEPLGMVVELHKRRREAQALVEALEEAPAPQEMQERPSEAPAAVTPAGVVRSFLARLLGR